VLQAGQIVLADTTQTLLKNPLMREAYLGELTRPRHARRASCLSRSGGNR
jgi:hypothetical protein